MAVGAMSRMPMGDSFLELWDEEGVIVADVCPTKALDMRRTNPWYRGQRPDLYYSKQNVDGTSKSLVTLR